MDETIRLALATDETIDITTMGRKSGQPRRIEIWFRQVNGRTYITGTPGPRDWYANLLENPNFTFHLKESVQADLPARARFVLTPDERRTILADPVMAWYHEQVESLADLVQGSPLIQVLFPLVNRMHQLDLAYLPDVALKSALTTLADPFELSFYDADYPSISDPGAYIHIRRMGEGYQMFRGNHGWSSGWQPTTAESILAHMRQCQQKSQERLQDE
jgi:deazaflavin-dependent oxidoreductase (nitroreductase family)